MGRKKVDKDSLEYMISHLFHSEDITGFQFTAGNTTLGIKEKRPLTMDCSISKSRSSVVIDCLEHDLEKKISTYIFGENYTMSLAQMRDYQEQFRKLGYEVEEYDYAGQWYWFRIKCTVDDMLRHINNLKQNLVIL